MADKQLLDEFAKSVTEFRGEAEKAADAVKKFGAQLSEHTEKAEKYHVRLDALEASIGKSTFADDLKKTQEKMANALEEFEAKLSRIQLPNGKTAEKSAHQKGFGKAIRLALSAKDFVGVTRHDFTPEETKALIVGNDTAGGYLAPMEFVNQLIDVNIAEISPIRPLCGRRQTSRPGIEIPTLESHTEATWVGETSTRTEQLNPSFGKREIKANEQLAKVLVSMQDLEDSVFDVEAMLRNEFAMQFGISENQAFLSGNGAGKPLGILVTPGLENLASITTNALEPDDIIKLQTQLKSFYLNNARYVFGRLTLREIRTMKDGQGQYLWQPGFQAGVPTLLAGYPYTIAVDMPTIATGNKPILFGDFRQGYLIVDRLEMQVQTNPYSSMDSGMVQFVGRRRVGGQVIVKEALSTLTIS